MAAGTDSAEIEALKAGQHRGCRGRDLLGLGGGKDKDHPRRRLLQNFQERVPRLAGQHVGFVDDVDLGVALAGCGVHGPLPQVPSVFHSPVAGGVDLDHVEIGGAIPDAETILAFAAGIT